MSNMIMLKKSEPVLYLVFSNNDASGRLVQYFSFLGIVLWEREGLSELVDNSVMFAYP